MKWKGWVTKKLRIFRSPLPPSLPVAFSWEKKSVATFRVGRLTQPFFFRHVFKDYNNTSSLFRWMIRDLWRSETCSQFQSMFETPYPWLFQRHRRHPYLWHHRCFSRWFRQWYLQCHLLRCLLQSKRRLHQDHHHPWRTVCPTSQRCRPMATLSHQVRTLCSKPSIYL